MTHSTESNPHPELEIYDSLSTFYSVDGRRRYSGEADYGVRWQLRGWPGRWRVSYIQATGEIYAHREGCRPDTVILMGAVPPDAAEGQGIYYHTLDRILEGWPEQCGPHGGLSWVMAKLEEYRES